MIEREIKFIVPGNMLSQYKNILDKLAVPERTLQINYYFDSPEFQLNSLRNTLRIRQKIKHLVLQYKYEKKCVGAERICQEFETEIRTFPLYISSKTFPNEINNPSPFYNYVGNLITERLEYLYNDTTIFLDKSYYLGKYDCEVEESVKYFV